MHKAWGIAIPGLLLVGAALLRAEDPAPIQAVRNLVFDNYQRVAPREYDAKIPVRIADIDEKSLDRLGQWPWSRATLAKVVDRLRELGAAVIAFDVLLTEPDRTGPKMIAANLPADPAFDAARAQMETLPDPDEQLAEAMSKIPTVIGFALLHDNPNRPQSRPKPIGGFAAAGESPTDFVPSFFYLVTPLPGLQAVAAGNGAVNVVPDQDGIIRRVPLLLGYLGDRQPGQSPADSLVPSLSLETIRTVVGSSSYTIRSSGTNTEFWGGLFNAHGIGAMRIFGTQITVPTNRGGELILRDTGPVPARYISIADLLDPAFPAEKVKDKIILIGTSVEGLKDIQTTPLASRIPGVEVHAETLEQIFDIVQNGAISLERPYWSDAAEIAYLVVFGVLVIGFSYRAGAIAGATVVAVSMAVAFGGSWYLFKDRGWLVDPLFPAGTALVLVMASTSITFIRTEREKRHIRGAFSMYLSPDMVEQLAGQPKPPKLGGENKEITVMFTDIRGFTKLSEGLDPQALTYVINSFLTPMSRVIKGHQGTIDKYIGDCIMAFWNAPLDVPHHAREAVRTAVEMRHTLKQLNEQFATEAAASGKEPVKIRAGVGLNTGIGCVGNMGSEERMAYSALGDTVNTAARLESLSPAYFVDLVLSEQTATDCLDFALLELDQVKVKGKAIPIRIFTCLGTENYAARPEYKSLREAHDLMLATYRRQDWEAAEIARLGCLEVAPERLRGLYALYEARIAEFQADPPGADWDGVYVAKSKTG